MALGSRVRTGCLPSVAERYEPQPRHKTFFENLDSEQRGSEQFDKGYPKLRSVPFS
jgi:hypothetical protein